MLEIQVIDLVDDSQHATDEEKISSSAARKQLLGTLLRPPLKVSRATESRYITLLTSTKHLTVCWKLL